MVNLPPKTLQRLPIAFGIKTTIVNKTVLDLAPVFSHQPDFMPTCDALPSCPFIFFTSKHALDFNSIPKFAVLYQL